MEWAFLQGVMLKLGFPKGWVKLIMGCVTTTSFSILINGNPHGHIIPSRGLRQGDPISPYLFLLCAERFTSLLQHVEVEGRIHGLSICRWVPTISYLLFADNSPIFCRASHDEIKVINDILTLYEEASGQCVSLK